MDEEDEEGIETEVDGSVTDFELDIKNVSMLGTAVLLVSTTGTPFLLVAPTGSEFLLVLPTGFVAGIIDRG